ncbi:MAG: prolyl oligopeptidase family serine peptidase, partial [Pirellulaceae bacterium]
ADSSTKQITFGPYDDGQATWSPTADEIAFTSNRTDEPDGNSNRDIWVVSADTAQAGALPERITSNSGSDSEPSWSPDGDELTYVSVIEPELIWYATDHLATAARSGENETVHTVDLDRSVAKPKYSSDGGAIYFLVLDHGMRYLATFGLGSSELGRLISGERSVTAFSVSSNGVTAVLIADANRPAEIFILDDAGLRQVTHANDELLSGLHLASTEKVTFASKDGTQVEAFVVKPPNFNPETRYPTILWIHGGPVAQFEYGFRRFEPKLFAENGYVVVMVNPRGSVGYGQGFARAIWQDWGNKDYGDVIAAIAHVIELGYAAPDRLGVGGWSYGGMLTDYVITKTTRFAGAISGASEAFYRANYGHDHYQLQWELEMGLPWENPELWDRISPFTHIDKVETPTMFIGGEKDWNVPIMNSEQLYQALRRRGVETLLVVYPGEHHGIRRPSFQRDRFERYLGWFGKYVK